MTPGSSVGTVTGNLGSITTKGLIFGAIDIAGNVTGAINSLGDSAVQIGQPADYYFRDQNGILTGGTLSAGGTIAGPIS